MRVVAALFLSLSASVAAGKAVVHPTKSMMMKKNAKNGKMKFSLRRAEEEDQDVDMSWMNGYTVRYDNCFHSDQVVTFRLCPAGEENSCRAGCSGGATYLIDLPTFVDAFTEAQMGAKEYMCEMIRENCEDDDEDQCYTDAGYYDECANLNEDENGFDLQEYLECKVFDEENGLYVGPYCDEDNYGVYLGVFDDEYCTSPVENGADSFSNVMGYTLPYSTENILGNECANCREHGMEEHQNGGDDADDDDDVLEQCEELYQGSKKCEDGLDSENPDLSGCTEISELQDAEKVTAGQPSTAKKGISKTALAWIGVVVGLLVLSCCGLGYFLKFRKAKNGVESSAEKSSDYVRA